MMHRLVCRLGLVLFAATPVVAVVPVRAQSARQEQPANAQLLTELGRLREAATLEAGGDVAGAEAIARAILQSNPTSLSALLILERLLTLQGRSQEAIVYIDRLLQLDPKSVIGHQTRLRVQSQNRAPQGIEAAANAWIRAMPNVETPYREVATVWRERGEHGRAIAVLEQGRKRIDRADALALELGDAQLSAGNLPAVAAEWTRAVGAEGRGFMLVQRRLQNLPDGGARLIPLLVDQLAAAPRTSGRLRAAALIAIDAGLTPRAQRYATELVGSLNALQRDPALVEIARRADGAGMYRIATWAYGEMLRQGREPASTLAIRSRLAELSLLAGDTALAAQVYQELEQAAAVGSPQRRQALALRIQLTAREGALERAASELERLRAEYPQAPELDATAAEVAEQYLTRGNTAGAEQVLLGVTGQRAAQLRGRIALGRGDLEQAREELLAAAPLLHGAEATETITLAALVVRLSAASGELLARVVSSAPADRERVLHEAAAAADSLPARERAAILDFLAGVAERADLPDEAERLRREIVAEHARSQEAPAALLALARRALTRTEAQDEARVLLEKIVLEYPRSALVPQARRELERLHGRS